MRKTKKTENPFPLPTDNRLLKARRTRKRAEKMSWQRNYKPMHLNSLCEVCNTYGSNRKFMIGPYEKHAIHLCWKRKCSERLTEAMGT